MPWQFHEDVAMGAHHVRDMLDPVLPQDAATRKWTEDLVGGESGNEVVIQADEPTDPLLELWVDYDAVGSEAVGADEVFIQNGQPVEPSAELWLDLDATFVADDLVATVAALVDEVGRLRAELDALKGGG